MIDDYQPEYRYSERARRINIRVKHSGEVIVSMPLNITMEEAKNFVAEKAEWIRKARNKMMAIKDNKTVFTADQEYRTKFRTLRLIPENRANIRLNVTTQFIEIAYPNDCDIRDERVQDTIRKAMEHAWKIEAYEYLPKQMKQLAAEHKLQFRELAIKNTRSFWGNCSADNKIVLSLHLMHLPDELIDYVILHELCHTVHKNHGAGFWKLLDQLTKGQARQLDEQMKSHSTKIY
ncbi:MAG: M48 family metallopeptidase [Prevotellaceae bacterium]|jgi:predicted metal-dependent hydrolase|nr:M48 family metallopeptidase [Prevotellaceae bacterium]